MKTILTSLFAAVLSLSLLAGCSSKKTIVGKWKNDAGVEVEFTKDGKLKTGMGGVSIDGTYTLPDDTHYKGEIDMGGQKSSTTVGYTIDGDTLTTDESGVKQTYKRVN